ncbi:WhiB family transcriptional regulator [Streptomyces sp. Je 1-79]|uniref:WhiB family transcriptional regulator n=1 Tax=Streptomyces sp. Je 1-79 TaxID=2943847 RepID=UPI0021A37A8C|nr:WhiB family transcriptional regulator [Streptomyces sp. Je 1-79]MCT4355828.1 WhiB family transcriptional regulator [Streptomyces sp. Je 1-79]
MAATPVSHVTAPPLSEALEFFGWRAAAACSGLPPQIVFARREPEARPALKACERCPVARQCEETVAPAESFFDGVSAGRLWRNGRPVRLRGTTVARPRTRREKPYAAQET